MIDEERIASLERDHNTLRNMVHELQRRLRASIKQDDSRETFPAWVDGAPILNYTEFAGVAAGARATSRVGVGTVRPIAMSRGTYEAYWNTDGTGGAWADLQGATDGELNHRSAVVVRNLGWPIGYNQRVIVVQDGMGDHYAINPVPFIGRGYANEAIAVGATGEVQIQVPDALNGKSTVTWADAPLVTAINFTGVDLQSLDPVCLLEDSFQLGFYIVGTTREINP